MTRRFDREWLADIRRRLAVGKMPRQHNQRASDSTITAAIAAAEPALVRAQYRRAIRFLDAHFEAAMDSTGPQAAREVLEKIHLISGERRRIHK